MEAGKGSMSGVVNSSKPSSLPKSSLSGRSGSGSACERKVIRRQ